MFRCCCLALLLAWTASSHADDLPDYESENTATSVRPPIGELTAEELLGSITHDELRNLELIVADEVAQLTEFAGETIRVHGVVQSTYIPESGAPVILNLGDDYKSCFKVVVDRDNFDHWNREASEIGALYADVEVLVEGTVVLYEDGLPQIKVMAPSQIRRVVDE